MCWLLQQADLPVHAFRSGQAFLDAFDPQQAGCLVLDVRMPEMGGLDIQQRLQERGIELPIIFLTAYGDVPTCARAFKAGALEFLEKPVDDAVLLSHVRKALARSEDHQPGTAADFATQLHRLTPRERGVLDLLIRGNSLKEIASRTGVSVQTVWRHRFNGLKKVGVESDVELVRLATQASYTPQD